MAMRLVVRSKSSGEDDDTAWADRCAYWLASRPEKRRYGRPPRQSHQPLILTGHGISLRVDHGALVVCNGFTHYPQRAEERRFFPGDRTLPSREFIIIDGSGTLWFDTLTWLAEQKLPLIKMIGAAGQGCLRAGPYGAAAADRRSEGPRVRAGSHVSSSGFHDKVGWRV